MTDWEKCYVEGHMPWNKGAPSPPMLEWVHHHQPQGRALMPGCGVGHDLAMLVTQGVDATGLDLSPTGIEMAKTTYPALSERFVVGDLFAMPADWLGHYDFVFEHTCLCALPPDLRGIGGIPGGGPPTGGIPGGIPPGGIPGGAPIGGIGGIGGGIGRGGGGMGAPGA